ncbi:hypothetical protein COUCH_28080 [Couchioplanes caeruleus]|uniref:hypothetical protein n=1 Tax=Couchioplanes caeruleus TaxID=56438 RepID=UPI0020BE03FA|nr:hypothetical protein [Couchioplanes caeruleus]UQU62872.1 hypothetical protein COUCH_28080 [Couchioplanes caeruleus]
MRARLVSFTSVTLIALAAAGCTPADSAPAASGTTPASPVSSRAASSPPSSPPSSPAPSRTSSPAPSATSDGGDGGMLAGLGEDANWKKLVTPCPNDGQKTVIRKVVTADVTGDGTYDALVARGCEARTSYFPSTVEVFDGASQSSRPRRIATLLEEAGATDQPWLTTVRVSGRQVVIEANGTGPRDTNACPSVAFTYRYRFSGDEVQRVSRDAHDARRCLPAG